MPRTQSQRALARRAAPQDDRLPEAVRLRSGVINAGLATLAVSVLGLGVAASAMSTSSAQDTHVTTVSAGGHHRGSRGQAAVGLPARRHHDQPIELPGRPVQQRAVRRVGSAGTDRGRREGGRAGRGRRAGPSTAGPPCWRRSRGRPRSRPTSSRRRRRRRRRPPRRRPRPPRRRWVSPPCRSSSTASRLASATSAPGPGTTPASTSPPRSAPRSTPPPPVSWCTPAAAARPAAGPATTS